MRLKPFVKNLIAKSFNHWDWKVVGVCFALACVFWIFNSLNKTHTANLSYPITFLYDKERYCMLEDPRPHIQFNVSGYGWELLKKSFGIDVKPLDIQVNTHRKGFIAEDRLLPMAVEQIPDLEINYLLEDTLFFELDTLISKMLAIKLNEKDLPLAKGVKLVSNIMASPEQVMVKGPAKLLASSPYTDSVRIELPRGPIKEDIYEEVAVKLPYHPFVSVEGAVQLRFQVEEFVYDTVSLSTRLINFPRGVRVKKVPKNMLVQYLRRPGSSEMDRESGVVEIDYHRINPKTKLVMPMPKVSSKYLDPECLTLKLKIELE